MYHFRKILERPAWNRSVTLEIEYDASPPYLTDDGECEGGVSRLTWTVVAIRTPLGATCNPDEFWDAQDRLQHELPLIEELCDYCLEDFAHRELDSGN